MQSKVIISASILCPTLKNTLPGKQQHNIKGIQRLNKKEERWNVYSTIEKSECAIWGVKWTKTKEEKTRCVMPGGGKCLPATTKNLVRYYTEKRNQKEPPTHS
jgi:hypothetical protein